MKSITGNGVVMLMLTGLLLPGIATATTYKWLDRWGTTHFTDNIRDVPDGIQAEAVGGGRISEVSNPHKISNLSREISFRKFGGGMVLDVSVNGVPARMMLDTGATFVTVPPAVASRAGIKSQGVETIGLYTANGRINVPKVFIRKMQVGDVEAEDIAGAIVLGHLPEAPDMGLLGMSYLERFKFHIDQERSVLILQRR